jgi:dihydrofolate synthase/folylpolyglutamate synthase
MTYQEATAYLFERLPMFQRIGAAAYKNDLTNTLDILKAIGNPHLKGKYIHVAGTNGKGSTSSMLASILTEAGYKVGLYTSPHLKSFTERIRINGEAMREEAVVHYVELYKPLIEQFTPSFFELTTAMAFDYFAAQEVDVAVIEVGLGGRLDSTNVIHPELSIITQIGLDHQQFLGDTTLEIVKEKAGIIKSNTPVITTVREPELRAEIQKIAAKNQAPYCYSADTFNVTLQKSGAPNSTYQVKKNNEIHYETLEVALHGAYQIQNMEGVLTAIEILNQSGFSISDGAIQNGLKNIIINSGLKGRWQALQERRPGKAKVIADTGHNQSAFDHIVPMLAQEKYEQLYVIFGAVNDKVPTDILKRLPKNAIYYFTQAQVPRAMPAIELYEFAEKLGLKGEKFDNVEAAWEKANEKAGENDLIFVGGSTFVVAEIPIL